MARKERDVNVSREWIKLFLGIALTFFGMGIVVYGLTHEPPGEIHESVVTTFGVVLGWAGLMFGIDSETKIRLHKQDVNYESKRVEQEKYFDIKKLELEAEMEKFRIERERVMHEKDKEKDDKGEG